MKKRALLCAIIFSISSIFTGCSKTERSKTERLPNIPEKYENNVLLESRGVGNCKYLKGDVYLNVIFVDDQVSSWTEDQMEQKKEAVEEATRSIKTQTAVWYEQEVNITIEYNHGSTDDDFEINHQNGSDRWARSILESIGYDKNSNEYGKQIKKKTGCSEAPVIYLLNKDGRSESSVSSVSYRNSGENTGTFEYSLIYNTDYHYTETIIHEIYHLFGAVDYYTPDDLYEIFSQIWPSSIMMGYNPHWITDHMTGYLMGLTDEVDENMLNVLEATNEMTSIHIMLNKK